MDQRDVLKSFYFLRSATPDDVAAVQAVAEQRGYAAGEVIFHQGDAADAIYLVRLGTVVLQVSIGDTVVATVGSGGEFGEVAFFDGGRRSASASTREPSNIIRIAYDSLRRVLDARPGLALTVYRNGCSFLAKSLRQTSENLSVARELNLRRL